MQQNVISESDQIMVKVEKDKCLYCGGCVGLCPVNAITLYEFHIEIDPTCTNCGICVKFCPVGALEGNRED